MYTDGSSVALNSVKQLHHGWQMFFPSNEESTLELLLLRQKTWRPCTWLKTEWQQMMFGIPFCFVVVSSFLFITIVICCIVFIVLE